MPTQNVAVVMDEQLGEYGFPDGHPFSTARMGAFQQQFLAQQLDHKVTVLPSKMAMRAQIELFHTTEYIDKVERLSKLGHGLLDQGDTMAFPGVYDKTARVVGAVLSAIDSVMLGLHQRAFVPIAGLHHARRDTAAGFCVFNDCGVGIEYLRAQYHITRIAYIDIDAHHGDGVFYSYEADPELIFADLHEDGRYLYPGTGRTEEIGVGAAVGRKCNIPMPPNADDATFQEAWPAVVELIHQWQPEFFLLQCGADSVRGDPLTHLAYTPQTHYQATRALTELADTYAQGRIIALGGGGYNLDNIANAWTNVVSALCDEPRPV